MVALDQVVIGGWSGDRRKEREGKERKGKEKKGKEKILLFNFHGGKS